MNEYKNKIFITGDEANLHVLYNENESGQKFGIIKINWFNDGITDEMYFEDAFELNAFEIENFSEEEIKKHFFTEYHNSHIENGGYFIRLFFK